MARYGVMPYIVNDRIIYVEASSEEEAIEKVREEIRRGYFEPEWEFSVELEDEE